MNNGVLARLRLLAITGVIGVVGCGANSRIERTAQPADAASPGDSANGMERTGSTMIIQTTLGTFICSSRPSRMNFQRLKARPI